MKKFLSVYTDSGGSAGTIQKMINVTACHSGVAGRSS